MPNVAINGLGRIGRAALKILLDADGLDLVAVNDIADVDNLAYLLKYDTVYGRYHRAVATTDGTLLVDGRRIAALHERDPANLPWADLGVDLVLECTGVFTNEDGLKKHIEAGASYVILSAPTTSAAVPTVVHGVNHPDGEPQIIPAPAAPPTASRRSSRSPTATSGPTGGKIVLSQVGPVTAPLPVPGRRGDSAWLHRRNRW